MHIQTYTGTRRSPSQRRMVIEKRHACQQEDWIDYDRIVSYKVLKVSIRQHLSKTYPHIKVLPHEDNVLGGKNDCRSLKATGYIGRLERDGCFIF